MRSAVKVSSLSMGAKVVKSVVLSQIRRNFVRRNTFDSLKRAHFDLQTIIHKSLDLKAAHLQDLWVLSNTGLRSGFFVEFGGYDGIASSNTYVLEKNYGWKGIVVEPAIGMKNQLVENRSCYLDFRAIWDKSNEIIEFTEDSVEGYLSVASMDSLINTENPKTKYQVKTVTLWDLLKHHNAPKLIDYISVDVEGSELRILSNFFENNTDYEISLWTVEHNFRENKEEIRKLFQKYGYEAISEELSSRDFWFKKKWVMSFT